MSGLKLGKDCVIRQPSNIYGCEIGDYTRVGTFVEIQAGAVIGKNCKIQSHSFICEGVTIEDEVFVGHGVMFCNDNVPRATNLDGSLKTGNDWALERTLVKKGASIGSGATILSNVIIGKDAVIGAGSVVTKNVPDNEVWVGNPARFLKYTKDL